LHAARPPSLRYGRTTLHHPAPPHGPISSTLCIRKSTQRNSRALSAVSICMVGSHSRVTPPPLITDHTSLPPPRRPLDPADPPGDHVRRWYENELDWSTVPADPQNPTAPVRLRVGERFDVLDVPVEA